jgi:hypothetical protein
MSSLSKQFGAMRTAFAQFRSIRQDEVDNKASMATRLTMPVLAIGGEKSFGSNSHHCAMKSRIARIVSVGASSISQCPAPGITTSVTLSAALRITV